MARDDADRVKDILSAIDDIRADTAGLDYRSFAERRQTVRAVLYSLGVIGEAVKNLSDDYKAERPAVPWRAIAGMRDRIAHEYFRTNLRRVWEVVTDELDALAAAVEG